MRFPWQRRAESAGEIEPHAAAPAAALARASFGGFGPQSAVIPVASVAESATAAGIGLLCLAAQRAELTIRDQGGREISHALLDALAAPDPRIAGNQGELLAAFVRAVYSNGYAVGRAVRDLGRIIEIRTEAGAYFRRGRTYNRAGRALPLGDTILFALGRELDGSPNADHLGAIRNAATLSQSAEQAMGRALRSGGLSAIVRKRDPQAGKGDAGPPTDTAIRDQAKAAHADREAGGPSIDPRPGAGPIPYFEIDPAESIDVIKLDAQQIAVMGAATDARRRVANALGIPAALISGEATGPELEGAWALFGRTVAPRLAAMIEAAFQPLLGTGEQIRVRPQSLALGAADQVSMLIELRQAHLLSVNQVLADLGRPLIGDAWADDPRLVANAFQPLRGGGGAATGEGGEGAASE